MSRKTRAPVRQKRPERGLPAPPLVGSAAGSGSRARVACIVVPLFPLAARLRCEPELLQEGLAIFEGDGHQARVAAATRPARQAGVRPGMTLAQARARMPRLVARARDAECERTAHEVLLEIAETFSPRVEDPGAGAWGTAYFEVGRDLRFLPSPLTPLPQAGALDADSLDACGTRSPQRPSPLTPLPQAGEGERREILLGEMVVARLRGVGLPARVGIASSKLAARVAAGLPRSPHVVPSGSEAEFLAPLPLYRLAPDAEVAATLERWGIEAIGALARLSANEVASRLGEAGRRLHATARGLDPQPLVAREPPPVYREGMTLEWPILQVEPLLFLARGALERLVQRLEARGFGCKRLELSLPLEPDGYHERSIELPSPTRDVKTLLTLLRLDLEAHSPEAPVRGFQLTAHPDAPRLAQLSLLGAASLSPDRLAETIARLFALLGPGRVGSPRSSNGHHPERFQLVEYTPPPPPKVRPRPEPGRGLLAVRVMRPPVALEVVTESSTPARPVAGRGQAGWVAEGVQSLAREPGIFRPIRGRERPVTISTPVSANEGTAASAAPAAPAARETSSPKPRLPRIQGKVRVASGPWELEERWWAEDRTERDYWDVELEDGALYRIYRDRRSEHWVADGVYD
ncbi:MAG TPA: DNA polymerase Y family protein [Thermoanaerobaculia bacterium]|nr:DNA polymerase Y family protein [Thermoanaerobaculia bacterium]